MRPVTYVGSSVALFLEDVTPGTFIRPCGLTNHTVTFTKNATEVTVPDCDDPELPAWIERGVESLDMSGSGNGILAAEAVAHSDERIIVNMGPQHPSTHGVLRMVLELDGEYVTECRIAIGYLSRYLSVAQPAAACCP